MKFVLVLAAIISALYIGTAQVVIGQLNNMKQTYQNIDQIVEKVAASDTP